MMRRLIQYTTSAMLLLACVSASGGTVTWTDAVSGDSAWSTAGNWTTTDGSTPPGTGDTAVVDNGTEATVNSTQSVHTFQLRNGSTVNVQSGTLETLGTANFDVTLANAGGTSYLTQSGGTIQHTSGVVEYGDNSGNTFHGRFSGGSLQHDSQLRVGNNSAAFDVEVSGTADWTVGYLDLNNGGGSNPASSFTHTGSAVVTTDVQLRIGENVTYNMDGGELNGGLRMDASSASPSALNFSGGTASLDGVIMQNESNLNISGGQFTVSVNSFIGNSGEAEINVTGGTVQFANNIFLGDDGTPGTDGATLNVKNGATLTATSNIYLHGTGEGNLLLGDATTSGTISGGSLLFGRNSKRTGTGQVRGWGEISSSSVGWDGDGTNASRIVADGYGADRSLQFTGLTSISQNTDDLYDGSGWYAQNNGKLELPGIEVTTSASSYNWGEDSGDLNPDLVNSARLTFSGLSGGPGTLSGSLLALDRSDVPAFAVAGFGQSDIFSVHDFSLADINYDSFDLSIRYDDIATTGFEDVLQLFHYTGGAWVPLDTSIDATARLVTATGIESFSLFAVGYAVPEPASAMLLALAGCGLLLRRTRRHV